MLRNLRITKKALLIVSAPLVLTVALIGTLVSIDRAIERAAAWALHSHEVLGKIEAAGSGLVAIHSENLHRALLSQSESEFELEERREAVRAAAHELQQMTLDNQQQSDIVGRFLPLAEQLLEDLAVTNTTLRAGRQAEGCVRAAADDVKLQQALRLTDELKYHERGLAVDRIANSNRLGRTRRWALAIGVAVTVLMTCVVGGWAMASMVRRLLIVQQNVDRLSVDAELHPPTGGRDEIARIDRAVHQMVRSLRAQRSDNEMFIYSVSHDLRSPLVNLQGFGKELGMAASSLRETVDVDTVPAQVRATVARILEQEIQVALHYIDLAVQRQARIIDSLLSLSRAGRVEYSWQRVQLQPIVAGIVLGLRNQEAMAGVEFHVGDLPAVHGDANALERVFDNLIGNAVKYRSPQRSGRIEIGTVRGTPGTGERPAPDHVVVFVRDNGIGIAPEHLDRAFHPFARFAGGKGEGIGLSLVRRVVDRHHGRVWLESELDVGTTVFVRLRAAPTLAADG